MKSFAVAALAGAASAAWAPPAYGGESSTTPVASSSVPAEEYSIPAYSPASSAPAYSSSATSSKPSIPTGYGSSASSASSSFATYACNPAHSYPNGASCVSTAGTLSLVTPSASGPAYGTGSISIPKPTGGYGGSWGNGTEGGHGPDSYVTQVVTSYETVCPFATTLTTNGATYTATESETLTITDCPCEATIPISSYTPVVTTEVVTSFTTTCPGITTFTAGPSTYTVSSSTVLTVTDCGAEGCTRTNEVPGTFVVPTLTTYCPSAGTITVGTETYPVTAPTTLTLTAPTSYATYTSVYSQPEQPTTVVIESSTYEITSATSIIYSQPTQGGYTVTAPYSSIYSAPPAGYTPAGPVGAQPTGGYAAPSGNSSSPSSPIQQVGNGAERVLAGGAAFGALALGVLLL